MKRWLLSIILCLGTSTTGSVSGAEPIIHNLWPAEPPGESKTLPPEKDTTTADDKLVGGRKLIRLGNVSVPQIAIYRPAPDKDTGASVVICPGGGHNILAYDLEGTEVADWLNRIGVTGIVLKYRVPAREAERRYRAAVQDAQRAVSMVRAHAKEWKLDPDRIGICGFSAGGETAALTSLFRDRTYEPLDENDRASMKPNFAILVYSGGMLEKGDSKLRDYIHVDQDVPPIFLVHAFDDRVSVQNSLLLASEIKKVGGVAELHVFATGGHGYGLRPTEEAVTHWPVRAEQWLAERGFLKPSPATPSPQ